MHVGMWVWWHGGMVAWWHDGNLKIEVEFIANKDDKYSHVPILTCAKYFVRDKIGGVGKSGRRLCIGRADPL